MVSKFRGKNTRGLGFRVQGYPRNVHGSSIRILCRMQSPKTENQMEKKTEDGMDIGIIQSSVRGTPVPGSPILRVPLKALEALCRDRGCIGRYGTQG